MATVYSYIPMLTHNTLYQQHYTPMQHYENIYFMCLQNVGGKFYKTSKCWGDNMMASVFEFCS